MITHTLSNHRKTVDKLWTRFQAAKELARNEAERFTTAQQFEVDATAAQEIAQNIAQEIQRQAHSQITGVVSNSLEVVFDEPYQFDVKFERKRGKTDAILIFRRNDLEVDPLSASGGGVVDVAALALRLSCMVLSCKPRLRKVLIMDEPFKFVSEEFRERVRAMLEGLSKQLKIQFIMVTHINELETGTIIRLKKSESVLKKITSNIGEPKYKKRKEMKT